LTRSSLFPFGSNTQEAKSAIILALYSDNSPSCPSLSVPLSDFTAPFPPAVRPYDSAQLLEKDTSTYDDLAIHPKLLILPLQLLSPTPFVRLKLLPDLLIPELLPRLLIHILPFNFRGWERLEDVLGEVGAPRFPRVGEEGGGEGSGRGEELVQEVFLAGAEDDLVTEDSDGSDWLGLKDAGERAELTLSSMSVTF
jgi:hypothetical protein